MALIQPPTWMQAGTYPARNDRLALTALLSYPGFSVDESTPMRIRQGVKPSYQNYQLKVRAAATPNMTVIVSAGYAFVDQHDTGGVGTYVCVNDGDVTLTVQPAGGAGQYRKDSVVASVYDAEYAGSVSEWRLEVIQGPYAASAGATVRGTLPPNAQILADIAIGPSQTSVSNANLSDIRQYSVAAGGIVPLNSANDMNHPAPGQVRYLMDTDRFLYGKNDGSSGELQKSLDGAWTSYTPVWSSSGTAPSVGNGTLIGRYHKIGRTVICHINLIPGSTTTYGTGNYNFSLPFPAASAGAALIGNAQLVGNDRWLGQTVISSSASTTSPFLPVSATDTRSDFMTPTRPETFGSGDQLRMTVTYEAAS